MTRTGAAKAEGRIQQVIDDITHRRHREAYALFCVGLVLTLLGAFNLASTQIMLSAVLAALTFLVFETAARPRFDRSLLEQVLQNRDSFTPFSKILPGVRDLRIYGPTAVSVVTSAADIRRHVLRPRGKVRL